MREKPVTLFFTMIVASVAALVLAAQPVKAAETIRFGKGFPTLFQFTPVDLGIEKGFFQKRGLAIELSAFTGDAKTQQAFAAGAIDMSIGSGIFKTRDAVATASALCVLK